MTTARTTAVNLAPHLPRFAVDWVVGEPGTRHRCVDGTLVFADVSGFTALSERLAAKGRIGAEELTDAIGACFEALLGVAYELGGSLVKFGGDALLLLFDGDGHCARAAAAAQRMRVTLKTAGHLATSVGAVRLRMSVGVHTGPVHLFLLGRSHRELLVTGPTVTETVGMEHDADAGEIVVSPAVVAAIGDRSLGSPKGAGRLLGNRVVAAGTSLAPRVPEVSDHALAPALPRFLRDHLLAGTTDPEHRSAVIAFVHFDGTDAMVARDPAAATVALDRLVTSVQDACDAHDVGFLATDVDADGGKFILVAGVPATQGDDDDRMLRCLRAIVDDDTGLPVRVGVNRGAIFAGEVGPVYRRTYTAMGDAVNLAARLMARAEPGQILTTRAVLDRSRTHYATTALVPFAVKGKAEPVRAFAVGPAAAADSGDGADTSGAAVPLIGRDAELAVLERALDDAVRGRGGFVTVHGDPGIGKSRLVAELTTRAKAAQVVSVTCEPYESRTPWFAVGRLVNSALRGPLGRVVDERAPHLRPWLPLLAAATGTVAASTPEVDDLDPAYRTARTHRVVMDLLDAVLDGPTTFVVEDAQWIDDASAAALVAIGRALADRPWLVIVSRTGDDDRVNVPDDVGAVTVALAPLDPGATAQLADAFAAEHLLRPDERERLVAHAAGNPLFLRELLDVRRAGADDDALMPDSLEAVIGAQIDRLDPEDRRLLRCASVLGTSFERDVLSAVVDDDLRAAVPAVGARLRAFVALDGRERYRFRNPCVRDVAYDTLPFRRRRELHARAGAEIERTADRPLRVAPVLSLHAFHAGDYERSWRYAIAAGWRARRMEANGEAAELFRRAIEAARHLPQLDRRTVGLVWSRFGDAATITGRYEDAVVAFRIARRLRRDEPALVARLFQREAAMVERRGGDPRSAIGRALRLVAGSDEHAAVHERAHLLVRRAWQHQSAGRPRQALEWCARALADAEATGNARAMASAHMVWDWAQLDLGRPDLATRSEEALAIWRKLKERGNEAVVLNNLGAFAYFEGRWDDALARYAEGREAYTRMGNLVDAAFGTCNIAEILIDQGRLDEAEGPLLDAARLWRSVGYGAAVAFAERHLGKIAVRQSRFDEADDLLGRARDVFDANRLTAKVVEVDTWIGECRLRRGDVDGAVTVLDAAISVERAGGGSQLLASLHRLRGYGHAAAGALVDAWADLDESLHVARTRRAPYDIALTLEAIGVVAQLGAGTVPEGANEERSTLLSHLGVRWTPPPPIGLTPVPA